MENNISTLEEIEFNIFKVLKMIETNKFLDSIFRDSDTAISYNLLNTMAKQNTLTPELESRINGIFNKIILTKQSLIDAYINLEVEITPTVTVSADPKKTKESKYYGKKRVLKDVEANGGKLTELDRALLSLNTLRNITSKLRDRGKKDKIRGTNILSESDCRDIIAAVRIVENKVSNILKKK